MIPRDKIDYAALRHNLVTALHATGIVNTAVLAAMAAVPRHAFMPDEMQALAYYDQAMPIGAQQTISQPWVVARMTELLLGSATHLDKVLEIGTGSGYQAAVLAQIADQVYTVERIYELYAAAQQVFTALHYNNIVLFYGDGHVGLAEHAPFTGIIVTAAVAAIPPSLIVQLADGGRLVCPVGDEQQQNIVLLERHGAETYHTVLDAVRFVPLLSGCI